MLEVPITFKTPNLMTYIFDEKTATNSRGQMGRLLWESVASAKTFQSAQRNWTTHAKMIGLRRRDARCLVWFNIGV